MSFSFHFSLPSIYIEKEGRKRGFLGGTAKRLKETLFFSLPFSIISKMNLVSKKNFVGTKKDKFIFFQKKKFSRSRKKNSLE
jgi:hypothetical protein